MSKTCPTDWLYQGFPLKTKEAFLAAPFAYGGSVSRIVWKKNADPTQRLAVLDALKVGLPAGGWTDTSAWSDVFKTGYKMLLSRFFSTSAVRALGATAGIDLADVPAGAQGATAIIEMCLTARVPIASPHFLADYARAVAKVINGTLPGGSPVAVDLAAESRMLLEMAPSALLVPMTVLASMSPPPPGPLATISQPALMTELAAMKSALAAMHAMHASPPPTPVGMTEAGLERILLAFQQANKRATETKEDPPTAAKAKSGWPKVLDDTAQGLINSEYVNIQKLSRGNRRHLEKESRSTSDSHKLSLGGATLLIAGPREDSRGDRPRCPEPGPGGDP
jgi:hypothetical protein